MTDFETAYKALNQGQKRAVDTIDGPVMVIAGPGTGKTQVLALRIAHILKTTDTSADSILCLTFTNAGVSAMRSRLRHYIGVEAEKVKVTTFHSFGIYLLEEFYLSLGFHRPPELLDDTNSLLLADDILENSNWEYLRPRNNKTLYFNDLKSLVSLLKRERYTPEQFLAEVEKDIENLQKSPESFSSRGKTKGELKKDVVEKISSLSRTKEVVRFYELYEKSKQDKELCDFNDILEYMVRLVELSDDVRRTIQEQYLYVLIDEHQDSSGIQNEFIEKVWKKEETQNVFVVGDDRQLIYGFGGASLSYFDGFKTTFPKAELITLTDNYRSTQNILSVADKLLASVLAEGALKSNHKENHPLKLVQADYPRDEIISAGLAIKDVLKEGILPSECVVLVPKNIQVRSAVEVLRAMNIPVVAPDSLRLFDQNEAKSILSVLRVIISPFSSVIVGNIILDPVSNIPTLSAEQFLFEYDARKVTLRTLLEAKGVFLDLGKKIEGLINISREKGVYVLLQEIAETFFFRENTDHEVLLRRIEIIRGFLHLAEGLLSRNSNLKLEEFLTHIDRLIEYGEHISIPMLDSHAGVQVLTLHGSKGLEFDFVWIAHLNEKSLSGSKKTPFTLPELVKERLDSKDEAENKRKLYVAITRAKRFCTLSYPRLSYKGDEESLAGIVADLPEENFERKNAEETENYIMSHDPKLYVSRDSSKEQDFSLEDLKKFVAGQYIKRKVSVTSLNNFFSCPWQWYFRSFLQIQEPLSESLQFGDVVHKSIEAILKKEGIPNKKELLEIIEEGLDKNKVYSESIRARMSHEALNILEAYLKNEYKNLLENFKSEKVLSTHFSKTPELTITGKIDLIEYETDNEVVVTDFKTGGTKKKAEIEKLDEDGRLSSYMRQLAMYSYLLRENTRGSLDVRKSQLLFLEEENQNARIYSSTISNEHIESLLKDIEDYDIKIKNGSWIDMSCHFKPWGSKETECPYCKKASIYKN